MKQDEAQDGMRTASLLDHLVRSNMKTISDIRTHSRNRRTYQERVADAITRFSGDIRFVYFHVLWFGVWILINQGLTPFKPFDPFPFGLLTMVVSLEAIFLSTFVLMSQNRQSIQSEERADLDLHIDLLAEHEVTKILRIVDSIARKVGADEELDMEVEELEQQLTPGQIISELKRQT